MQLQTGAAAAAEIFSGHADAAAGIRPRGAPACCRPAVAETAPERRAGDLPALQDLGSHLCCA